MESKILLALIVGVVLAVSVRAAPAGEMERPETPLLTECEEPGENRENCFIWDSSNAETWREYLDEISAWEKQYPKAAQDYNSKNPATSKQEKAKLVELEKYAAIHEEA